MKAPLLIPILLVLSACGRDGAPDEARQPAPLHERFYSGCALPGEFQTPESLPAIPASFEEDVQ
ncbi:hypothetical protein TMS3_0124170 [Pseudomonas taeanensis MS-3]|uniref:Lipoprotein n=1 Tax=Pseudomonas taeanensis MS-3 TaxID=1395571 RepID=A0A0A1YEM3_9PSED|nr:hypothetical protein [Pseudomonas taeanensis]KFX67421.1 hypothetical protein TMS3_0124170 [Pseudomonas taeanensis MS-3]